MKYLLTLVLLALLLVGCGAGGASTDRAAVARELAHMIEHDVKLKSLPYAVGEVAVSVNCSSETDPKTYRCYVSATDDTGPVSYVVKATCDDTGQCIWNPES